MANVSKVISLNWLQMFILAILILEKIISENKCPFFLAKEKLKFTIKEKSTGCSEFISSSLQLILRGLKVASRPSASVQAYTDIMLQVARSLFIKSDYAHKISRIGGLRRIKAGLTQIEFGRTGYIILKILTL